MKQYMLPMALALLVVAALLFVRTYTSSPGFVTQEAAEAFYENSPSCYGFSFLLNPQEMAADAPGKSLCIGLLR